VKEERRNIQINKDYFQAVKNAIITAWHSDRVVSEEYGELS
jgi:hypothetical protein